MNRYEYPSYSRPKPVFSFSLNDRVRPTKEWYVIHGIKDKGFAATIVKIDSNGYHLHWDGGIIGYADIFKANQIEHEQK